MISDFVGIQGDPGSLVGLTHIWDSGAAVEPRMEHLESKSTQPKVRDLLAHPVGSRKTRVFVRTHLLML